MAELLQGKASKEAGERPRRSWLAPALAFSLAAHAGLAAMLWVEQPPQPKAGAVVGVEIVSAAGAPAASAADSGAASSRGKAELARPAAAPPPSAPAPPDAPREARAAPSEALPPREAPPVPSPERLVATPSESTALRRPAPSTVPHAPSAAETPRPPVPDSAESPVDEIALRPPERAVRETARATATPAAPPPPRALAGPRAKEIALRRPARIPPPPANAPRAAGPPSVRGTERAQARPRTASVPIVAADAAPGAGPENGSTTPPRYGFGSAANPIPRYPRTARENGWEGVVMLTVMVSAAGEALSVSIVKSSGHGLLDASAVDAVRRWRFDPARRAGIPVSGTATVPIRFRLEE